MTRRLFLLLFFIPLLSIGQNTISGTFTPAENYKWGLIYRITPTSDRYTTDTKIEAGSFSIAMDSTAVPGMYRFVYAVPPEENNFEFIYNGEEDIQLSFSETEGVTFIASEENKAWSEYQTEVVRLNHEIAVQYGKAPKDSLTIQSLISRQREAQTRFEKASKNMIAGSFIRASRPYMPDSFEESIDYFQHNKETYFDAIDVTNPTLQKSRFLLDQCFYYIQEKEDIDTVATFLKAASKEYQKSILLNVWQAFVNLDQSEMANYLSRNHLSPLAEELKETALVKMLFTYESLSIGAKAPNFSWKLEDGSTRWFHELTGSEHYILVFWSSSCPHCLQELPKLQKKIQALPKGKYQVVAFGLEDDIYNWKNESLRLPEFLHIPGMGKWQNEVGRSYDISQTPTYFLLDKDKNIMAKPDELEALVGIISEE
ncbi:MAG: thioredoxin family protein [Bacteroidota bacterium]